MKALWYWLEGSKTTIGIFLGTVYGILATAEVINPTLWYWQLAAVAITAWTGFAINSAIHRSPVLVVGKSAKR